MAEEFLLGSIEAGGTKFILAVADTEGNIKAQKRIPTEDPETTIKNTIEFFKQYPIKALGIGTFGPIDIDKNSKTYGYILSTPKPGWSNFDLKGSLERGLDVPAYITTDVNSSAYGEYIARGKDNNKTIVYITIGTGVGGGIIQNGHFIGKNAHPEMGHMIVQRHPKDTYEGYCLFHGSACVEGMAAGPTLKARTGIAGEDLARDNEVFDFVAYYVAQMLYNVYMSTRADVMVVGGSVLNEDDLKRVRKYFKEFNHDYVETPDVDKLIVRPAVENNGSATLGNFALAKKALED